MVREYILAHDLGTTGNKATLYSSDGTLIGSSVFEYETYFPQVNWVEQDPRQWWEAVCASTRQLLEMSRVAGEDIACVSFSGQMMGCLPVGKDGEPLRNSIIWADQRGVAEAEYIRDRVGWDEVYRITGHRISPTYSAAKFLWIREHEPEVYRNTHKILHAKDFIVSKLTGKFATDYSDASGMNLLDLTGRRWSPGILDGLEISEEVLPELHASTDVVGEVTREAAEETGLAPGIPVIIGGGDGCCAATGAGVVSPGSAYNYLGSSSWIALATEAPILDPEKRTFNWVHVVPGMYSPCGTMQSAGGSYQWLRNTICLTETAAARDLNVSPYELMNLEVEKSPPGSHNLIFLPYLLGERSPYWNPNARGAFIGLTQTHTRADILRSVMEGITFNLRIILEAFEEQGAVVDAIRAIGGGARSSIWRSIMANIYGKPVLRPQFLGEATSLGAAIIGGVGVGIFRDFSVADDLVKIVDAIEPNPAIRERYNLLYPIFRDAYASLLEIYDRLADLEVGA
ncbi:MAG: xylulokinase [bacterium]